MAVPDSYSIPSADGGPKAEWEAVSRSHERVARVLAMLDLSTMRHSAAD